MTLQPTSTDGSSIWKEFIEPFATELMEVYPRLRDSVMLFGQATVAFDAGAHMGAVILCRAALESGLYTLKYTKRKHSMSWDLLEPPRSKKYGFETVRMSDLLKYSRKKITKDEHYDLARIKNHGDFVAHITDRLQRGFLKAETIEEIGKVRLWMSNAEALEDLKDTAAILHSFAVIASKEPFNPLPISA